MDENCPDVCSAELNSWNSAFVETGIQVEEWERRNIVDCLTFICNIAADFCGADNNARNCKMRN
jgi:hypothetical protein